MTAGRSAYQADAATPSAGPSDHVTLVAGSSFVQCALDGEIEPGGAHGYYAGDTRVVSLLRLRVAGARPRVLRHDVDGRRLRVIGSVGDPVAPDLVVDAAYELSHHLRVTVAVQNLRSRPAGVLVDLTVGADFADIFDVKRGVVPRGGFIGSGPADGALHFAYESDDFRRSLRVEVDHDAEILRDGFRIPLALQPRAEATVTIDLDPRGDGTPPPLAGVSAMLRARESSPSVSASSPRLVRVWDRSCHDLTSLYLSDPIDPDRTIVAAGSPWFMALFGRDSLIASWQSLPLGRELVTGVLFALAARQGTDHVAVSAEQPGRIPHEVRSGEVVQRPGGWGEVYYGSVDATPLFVMTLAEAWRWGADPAAVAALLPAAEAAVGWMAGPGDADGDGFVDFPGEVVAGAGLANQAWKDSDDAVRHPDGSLAHGPIAMVEVQGYCHAAHLALADLREAFGTGDPEPLRRRAEELRAAIEARFWLDDQSCYALALDGDGEPVRSVSTNAGHLLWTGTAAGERATRLADRLMDADVFTGFGLRTLSARNHGYNPLSYHCGSVWPHDTAIVAAGMLRCGAVEPGRRLASALLDAAAEDDGRLPELFGGFSRERFAHPVPYPTSCSPQAWSAGAPLLLVRALLGMDPDVPAGVLRLRPRLPADLELEVRGLRLGDATVDVHAAGHRAEVSGAGEGLRVEIC